MSIDTLSARHSATVDGNYKQLVEMVSAAMEKGVGYEDLIPNDWHPEQKQELLETAAWLSNRQAQISRLEIVRQAKRDSLQLPKAIKRMETELNKLRAPFEQKILAAQQPIREQILLLEKELSEAAKPIQEELVKATSKMAQDIRGSNAKLQNARDIASRSTQNLECDIANSAPGWIRERLGELSSRHTELTEAIYKSEKHTKDLSYEVEDTRAKKDRYPSSNSWDNELVTLERRLKENLQEKDALEAQRRNISEQTRCLRESQILDPWPTESSLS